MDPITLEVTLVEPLRRPLGQLSGATFADFMALSEVDSLRPTLARALKGFADRAATEVPDIPDGPAFAELCAELAAIEAERVPEPLRRIIAAEADRQTRPSTMRRLARQLVHAWEGVDPQPWEVGTGEARIQRASVANAASPAPRSRGGARSTTRRTATPKPKLVDPVEQARTRAIMDLCVERLAGYSSGLAETVLLAGVLHRGRGQDAGIAGRDVLTALKELETLGTVQKKGKRWVLAGRW